ncbi:carboxynorspermidine decarboxylase [uncultured Selenomonas sp.]|uniref:carboxynorspermidine decarboxylase n=1 Tax=uncultured Selenomonas sp. TaxID=159275 RepID=UPI0028D2AE6A|nr:carboxynorspermidine decarboxylase [uncultured Selenomonas sp.]
MGETFGKFEKYAGIFRAVPTPSYVVMEELLRRNLAVLRDLQQETGAHVLLAQKAFSMFRFYPLIAEYLAGAAASGLFEARLAYEEMPGKENHVFSPAFKAEDMAEIVKIADHIVFNSFAQWEKYGEFALKRGCACGLRINPEHSTQEHAIYDPCSAGSRLGVKCGDFRPDKLDGLTGLHFHTLCEQGAEPLAETLEAVEEKFGAWLPQMEWINFGGGHHITREGYDIDLLKRCIMRMQTKYGLKVYIEPGEAIALDAGFLVAEVLEIVENDTPVAILDTSAACHMPDVIEMPYRPPVLGAGEAGEKPFTYTFAGPTCLAGDMIGTYSFDAPLAASRRVVFGDMAIYTMVKNNTFNGMPLPAIVAVDETGAWQVVCRFGYEDFKMRLS